MGDHPRVPPTTIANLAGRSVDVLLMVDRLAGRREELAAALDDGALLTEDELMAWLGLEYGDWRRGRDHDVLPGPDRGPFWSRAAADDLAAASPGCASRSPRSR